MNIDVLDLNGETKHYTNVHRFVFTNHETFANPEAIQHRGDERLLVVNTNNYTTLLVKGD